MAMLTSPASLTWVTTTPCHTQQAAPSVKACVAVSIYRLLLFSCFQGKLAPPSSVFLPARQRLGTAQCIVNVVY